MDLIPVGKKEVMGSIVEPEILGEAEVSDVIVVLEDQEGFELGGDGHGLVPNSGSKSFSVDQNLT